MPTRVGARLPARVASLAVSLGLAVAAVVVLLGGGGRPYTIHAHFVDAGQVVSGNLVEVSGQTVGQVSDIRLTDRGEADLVLSIDDSKYQPLHRGTIASIQAAGLAGIANRFVDLSPGPRRAPAIPDGGVLTTRETRPIVELDEVLDSLNPRARTDIQHLIRSGAQVFAGSAALGANRAFARLDPALAQTSALSDELASDRAGLERLIATTARVSTTLAARRADIEEGIDNTAVTLRALASEDPALDNALVRAPVVMRRSHATFARLRSTLSAVRPALRDARPVARPLARVLRDLVPTAQQAIPAVDDVRSLLPGLQNALLNLPPLAHVAVPAVERTTDTLQDALPIFRGLRPYAPDVIAGLLDGFGGSSAGFYDANGHYAHLQLISGPGSLSGLGALLGLTPPGGPFGGFRRDLVARCPGGATGSADDGSNPWRPEAAICKPKDDM